jgi:hypothetical protein
LCTLFLKSLKLILVEWETSDGTFVALGNKMYQCFCRQKNEVKKSTKGVPHNNNFATQMFIDVLLDETTPKQTVDIHSLRLNREKEISRISMTKTSLSDVFVKMRVEDDKITCRPLTRDGVLI